MEQSERTRKLLVMHYQKYPHLQIQDIFKYLYQSSFGCEHMVSSLETAIDYIRKESSSCPQDGGTFVDVLDGAYSRVHLAYLNHGLSAQTLGKLFFVSSKKEPNGKSDLENKLNIAKELVCENALPFSPDEFERAIREWQAIGYPAMHHSNTFRMHYNPAYRVVANKYITFLPLFARIDEMLRKGPVKLAIDGGSASGKTTLSEMLNTLYDCTVFHMDDFFLRPEQRTAERYAEVGGNVDRERFLEEVLIPLRKNEPINYRKFDCSALTLSPPTLVIPKKLTIIEGAYSMHPELADYYDLSVFLDVSPELQRTRIAKRNSPQTAQQFYNKWIPLEKTYFSKMQVKERSDMSVLIRE